MAWIERLRSGASANETKLAEGHLQEEAGSVPHVVVDGNQLVPHRKHRVHERRIPDGEAAHGHTQKRRDPTPACDALANSTRRKQAAPPNDDPASVEDVPHRRAAVPATATGRTWARRSIHQVFRSAGAGVSEEVAVTSSTDALESRAGWRESFLSTLVMVGDALATAGIPHALVGGLASSLRGRPRWTEDIDVLVAPVDADAALETLGKAGFETERTNPYWIYKATRGEVVVDLIFALKGGIYFDDEMASRSTTELVGGRPVRVVAPEDLVVMKAIAHDEPSAPPLA